MSRNVVKTTRVITRVLAIAALMFESVLAMQVARAQQAGIKRTDLQRHDLSAPGREAIQVRVDFDPGALARFKRARRQRA